MMGNPEMLDRVEVVDVDSENEVTKANEGLEKVEGAGDFAKNLNDGAIKGPNEYGEINENDIEQQENLFNINYNKFINFLKKDEKINKQHIIGSGEGRKNFSMYTGDLGKELLEYNWSQIKDLLHIYNKENPTDLIEEDFFEKMFLKKKKQQTFLSSEEYITNQEISAKQEVSKFILTIEHQEAIRERLNEIITNGDEVATIELEGWASGDLVGDNGRIAARNQINYTLQELQEKGFDVSKVPNYDEISQQDWFDADAESLNQGNHSRAYARALMQLNALTKEQLQYLSKSKIIFDIKSNTEKGDQHTGGSIDFYGYKSSFLRQIREDYNILEQNLDIGFKITEYEKPLSNPNNNINLTKAFEAKINNNTDPNNIYTIKDGYNDWKLIDYKYRGSREIGTKVIKNRPGSYTFVINLTEEQAKKYKEELSSNSLENWDFEKFVDIYESTGKADPEFLSIIQQYREYPQKRNNIQEELDRIKEERGEELL